MSKYTSYYHRNKAPKKPATSRAREYAGGYLSRSQIGHRLGLKGHCWATVQKTLGHAGLVLYNKVDRTATPTEKADGLWRLEGDVSEQGDVSEWIVWHPSVVEMLREPLVEVLAGHNNTEKVSRVYPTGYVSLSGLASELKCSALTVSSFLQKWDFAKLVDNKIEAVEESLTDGSAVIHEEKGKSWAVWNRQKFVREFNEHFARVPEDRK